MRDIAPTGVRLPPTLRDALQREAAINNRSLSQEITQRLLDTMAMSMPLKQGPRLVHTGESPVTHGVSFTDIQRQLLGCFDAMAPDKQLALLTLLKR